MPIIANAPLIENEIEYSRVAVNLAISPIFKEADLGPAMSVRFTYYDKNEDGSIRRPETDASKNFVYCTLNGDEPEIDAIVRKIMDAVEELATLRGI
jgi:hypothetical protein